MAQISEQAKNDIKHAYDLYKTYEKNEKAIQNGKFTNLFLAHVGDGDDFAFVKRYSLVGICKRIWAWITRADTFNFNRNFDLVNKLYQKIYSECNIEDTKQLDEVAKELGIKGTDKASPGQILRQNLLQVGYFLNNVESSRFVKKTEDKPLDVAALIPKRSIPLYEKRVQAAHDVFERQHMDLNEKVFSAIDSALSSCNLSGDERNAVAFSIATSTDREAVLLSLQNKERAPLLLSLRETLSTPIAPATRTFLREALQKIAPAETLLTEKFAAFVGSEYARGPDTTTLEENKSVVGAALKQSGVPDTFVADMLVLSSTTASSELKAKVEALGVGQTCHLLGGAEGRPMVIAIEKQAAGYTLKLFQQEPGVVVPSQLKSSEDKNRGYLEYHDVKEQPLLTAAPIGLLRGLISSAKPSLLEAFIELRKLSGEAAATYFEKNIAQQLPNPQEGNAFIRHLLLADRPGTEASKAIVAARVSQMSEVDAVKMLDRFQGYLLQSFQSDLQALSDAKIPKERYQEIRANINNMKRSFDDAKGYLHNVSALRGQLALYADIFDRLEQKLALCQKELAAAELPTKLPIEKHLTVNAPHGKAPPVDQQIQAKKFEPTPLSEATVRQLATVKTKPTLEALKVLATLKPESDDYLYICECFFRQAGSLDNLKALGPEAIHDLQTVINALATQINVKNADTATSERFGMLLLATFALESAYKKLPVEQNLLGADVSSTLATSYVYENVKKLQTSDPFWTARFAEIRALREGLTEAEKSDLLNLFPVSLHSSKAMPLSDFLAQKVVAFVRNDAFATGKKIDKSIDTDRTLQLARIKQEIEVEKKNLASLKGERQQKLEEKLKAENEKRAFESAGETLKITLADLEGKLKALQDQGKAVAANTRAGKKVRVGKERDLVNEIYAVEAKQEEIRRNAGKIQNCIAQIAKLEAEIKELDGKIAISEYRIDKGIELDVHADAQYWPWGIGKQDIDSKGVQTSWDTQKLAKFFLAEHEGIEKYMKGSDPMPAEFRRYVDVALVSRNIFNKTDNASIAHVPITMKNDELYVERPQAAFTKDIELPNVYVAALEDPSYKELYKYLYSVGDINEVEIPYAATEGVQAAFEAKNKGPSIATQVAEAESVWQKGVALFKGGYKWGKDIVKGVAKTFEEAKVDLKEELRELCQLHCSKDMQIDSTISYFQEDPKRLFSNDGRLLFHALLFESDLLLTEFKDERKQELVVERLKSLFQGVISSSRKDDPESCANVVWLAATAQKYLDASPPKDKALSIIDAQALRDLTNELAKSENKQIWPEVFECLLAAQGQLSTTDDQMLVYGLITRAMRRDKAIEDQAGQCLPRARDADRAEVMLKDRLALVSQADQLQMLNSFSQDLLGAMYPSLATASFIPADNKAVGVFTTIDKKTTISLTDGVITSTDPAIYKEHADPVPVEAISLLVDQQLYASREHIQALRCHKAGSIFTISDKERGILVKVDLINKDIFVQPQGMPWCHHLHADDQKIGFNNQLALREYHQWYDAGTQKTYLADTVSFKPVYEVQKDRTVISCKTGHILGTAPEKSTFSAFEDPSHTLYWTDKAKNLQAVEFPRLKIRLEKLENGEFCLQGSKEWTVAKEQFVPHFEQKDGFIVLEKAAAKGKDKEVKVLFPAWDVQVGGAYDLNSSISSGRTIECSLSNNMLMPKSVEGRYYLAKLYLARGNIDQAEALLYAKEADVTSRKLDSGEAKNATEAQMLRDIALWPIEQASTRQLKLQMHALYLVKKNEAQFPKEALKEESLAKIEPPSNQEIQAENALVTAYCNAVPDARRLDPSEEEFIFDSVQMDVDGAMYRQVKNSQLDKIALEKKQPLEQLSKLSAIVDDRAVMRHVREEYFTKAKKAPQEPVGKELFSTKSPEIPDGDINAKAKFDALARDIEKAQTALSADSYSLRSGKDLSVLQTTLKDEHSKEKKLLAYQETLIVNSVAQALSSDPKALAAYSAKEKLYPTIDELCLLCARKDFHAFAEKHYPQLNEEGRDSLQEAVKKYFFQKETVQQLGRSYDAVTALIDAKNEGKNELLEGLQDALGDELDKIRAYPPDHPYAMIFLFIETTAGIKLRADQVQNILKLAEAIREDKNLVLQMIMGAGKTAVIQPFLAILLADPGALSTVMVPEAQFPKVRAKLAATLGQAADKALVTFPYDIELSQDIEYIDKVLTTLKTTKETGGVVLLASRQMHSILTSFYEAFYSLSSLPDQIENKRAEVLAAQGKQKEALQNELDELLELQKSGDLELRVNKISELVEFLQVYESLQMDEIDMIMNSKVVFKKPIGKRVVFDEKSGFQQPRLLTELLIALALDPKLNEEISIDFANAMQSAPGVVVKKEKSAEINEQLYADKVQPFLVNKALELFVEKKNPQLTAKIGENRACIEHFLTQTATKEERDWIKANITDADAKALLEAATLAITSVFKTSLLRECKANYGKDPLLDQSDPLLRKYVARPYAAPGAPKPTVYADPHEKIIYSVQYYLYNGIPLQDAKEMLVEWQKFARKEMKGRPFEETAWFGRFEKLQQKVSPDIGIDFLADPKSKEFEKLAQWFQKAISKDKETILEFCQDRLFKQNTIYTKNVTSTPQTLAGSSSKVFGYTGTMHEAILATFMKALPEEGTDGKTIAAMENKIINETASVDTLKRGAKLAEEVVAQFKDKDYNVFIDSGNWLKEVKIEEFAKRLLTECGRDEIEGVVFHDVDGNEVCIEKAGSMFIIVPFEFSRLNKSPEKRLTIILSRFETGTDITQRPTAKAFMSVRKDMTLRDALQSAFRMRKILLGQSVSLKFSDEVKSHVAQSLLEGLMSHDVMSAFVEKKQPIDEAQFVKALDDLKLELPKTLREALVQAVGDYNKNKIYTPLAFQESFNTHFKPDSHSAWRYFAANLAKVEQDKNWAAMRHKIRETFEKPVRKMLANTKMPLTQRLELFKKVEKVLVQTESGSRFDELVKGVRDKTQDEAIKDAVDPYLAVANSVLALRNLPEDVSRAMAVETLKPALEACVNKEQIAKTISGVDPDRGGEMELQLEAEVEQEQEQQLEQQAEVQEELEQEAEVESEKVPRPKPQEYQLLTCAHPQDSKGYDIDSLFKKQFKAMGSVLPKKLKLAGSDSLEYSENFIFEKEGKVKLTNENYAANRLAARYMLLLKDGDTTRQILVSHEDAARIKRGLYAGNLEGNRVAVLSDLNGKVVAQSKKGANLQFNAEAVEEMRVVAKFLTVKSIASRREVDKLKEIIDKDNDPQKLLQECRKYYETCVAFLPTTLDEYNGSYLGRVLNA